MVSSKIVELGSLFAITGFHHFIVDWLDQSEEMALAKSKDWQVRAKHVTWYTFGMMLMFGATTELALWQSLAIAAIFWLSHFWLDTYKPVQLWMKYARKPMSSDELAEYADKMGWVPSEAVKYNAMQMMLAIVADQIFHLIFVMVCCVIAVQ